MTTRAQLELTAIDRTKQAFDSVNRNLQSIGDRVNTMLPVLGRVGPAIAAGFGPATIGAAIAGAVALAKAQADSVDQFNDLKDATGASIENISALDDLARRTGTSFETVGSALIKFNDSIKEANDPDKGAGAVFKALNLDVQKLKQLDPAEAMRQTAQALAGFADDGNKARAVQELFGRSVREVAPLLKDLSEQGSLNAKVTTEQAEEAEKFNKHLFAMQTTMNDIGRSVAGPLIRGFNELAGEFKNARREGDSLLEMLIKFTPQGWLAQKLGVLGKSNGYTEARENIATLQRGLQDPSLSASERAAMQGELAREQQRMAGYLNSTAGAGRGGGYGTFDLPSLDVPEQEKKKRDKKEKEDKSWLENRKEWLQRYDDQEKQRKEIEDRAAKDLAGWMERWSQEGDAMSRRLAADERAVQRRTELDAELNRLSGRTGADRDAVLRDRIRERQAEGSMTPDEAAKAIKELDDATKKATDGAREFGGAFSSALEGIFVRAQDAGDVLKGLAANILSIGIQKSITNPLGDRVGGFLSSMFSFDGGGYTGNGVRSGGLDGKGGFMALLHPQETVVDHTKSQQVSGGVNNTYHIQVNASDNASKADLAKAVQFALAQVEARQRRTAQYGA